MSKYYFQYVQVIQPQYASMDQDAWTCHTSNNVLVGWATVKRNRFELLTKYLRFDLCSTRPSRRQQTKFTPMGSAIHSVRVRNCWWDVGIIPCMGAAASSNICLPHQPNMGYSFGACVMLRQLIASLYSPISEPITVQYEFTDWGKRWC